MTRRNDSSDNASARSGAASRRPVRRSVPWYRRLSVSDVMLGAGGIALCAGAVFFPWHVYMHPEVYGPPEMKFSRGGVIPPEEVAQLSGGSAVLDTESGKFVSAAAQKTGRLDAMTTGRVDPDNRVKTSASQPFPGTGRLFRVYAIDATHALVGDADGIYLVRPQSRLPDGTFVLGFDKDDEGWLIRTSADLALRVQ